ncbi:MAG: twin-arginine translocase TatA/TatE family subunit [Acidimicrobiales bacterium]
MFNFSPEKLMLVGVIALIVLGPNRLPGAARSVAKVLVELRRMSGSFQTEVRDALAEPREVLHNAVGDLGINDLRGTVRGAVNELTNPVQSVASDARSAVAGPVGTGPTGPPPDSSAPADQPPVAPDDPSLN